MLVLRTCLSLGLGLTCLWSAGVQAQSAPIVGDISGAEFRPYPIAIPSFRPMTPSSDAVATAAVALTKQVRDDLDLSGVFRVINPKSYIDTDGVLLSTVRFDDWLNVGADGLVKAMLRSQEGGFTVELHAYEVARQREGLTRSYVATAETLRAVGHRIADDLYRHFTGEPGIFRTRIAVVKKVAGEKQIFVMDMDGEGQQQITRGGGLNLLPAFSPDGKSVLFTSYRDDNPDLFEVSLADGRLTRLSHRPGLNTGGRVSPDGQSIVLTLSQDGNSELYLLDRKGESAKRLTQSWGIDTSPVFSPDGRDIVFVSSRAGSPQIYRMPAAGGPAKRLTFQGNYNQTPAISPRGDLLAFTARDEFNRFDIFTLDLTSGQVTRLTQDQGNNEDPSFSPNGRLIAFTSTRTGSRQVFLTNLDGTHQRQITAGGDHSSPSWGPFVRK